MMWAQDVLLDVIEDIFSEIYEQDPRFEESFLGLHLIHVAQEHTDGEYKMSLDVQILLDETSTTSVRDAAQVLGKKLNNFA